MTTPVGKGAAYILVHAADMVRMLSNFITQLAEQNASHRFNEVLAEGPRVREDMGYPPLVTPTSQIVGTQAVMNVLLGRYKNGCQGLWFLFIFMSNQEGKCLLMAKTK